MTKIGATRISDAIELLPTKHIMPKTSSNDQISAVFEKIAKALNNPKLREGFLNGKKENEILNETVEVFDRKTDRRPRVSPNPNIEKIAHVPARVNQNPTKCDQDTQKSRTYKKNRCVTKT